MNISALVLMIATLGLVTGFTIYFFIKVLRSPQHQKKDGLVENSDVPKSDK